MFPDQSEFRRIVVEEYFRPTTGRMTVATCGAHSLAMDIVGFMAR